MLATVVGAGLPFVSLGLLAGAGASYFYVPLVGRALAVALTIGAAGLFAFDEGFRERGSLDRSATLAAQVETLKANVAEERRQAEAARAIATTAADAETKAQNEADEAQQKVAAYEVEIAKRPVPGCGLSDDDVGRLRGIGAARRPAGAPRPSRRPVDIRPAGGPS
jgi:enoyl-CoA hydratase/carnithine racemase